MASSQLFNLAVTTITIPEQHTFSFTGN